MDDEVRMIAERYFGMLQQIEAVVVGIKGEIDAKKLIAALQIVHLAQIRRWHDTLQKSRPEGQRQTFPQYLEEIAKHAAEEEASASKKKKA